MITTLLLLLLKTCIVDFLNKCDHLTLTSSVNKSSPQCMYSSLPLLYVSVCLFTCKVVFCIVQQYQTIEKLHKISDNWRIKYVSMVYMIINNKQQLIFHFLSLSLFFVDKYFFISKSSMLSKAIFSFLQQLFIHVT